jgi:hypothetical protein
MKAQESDELNSIYRSIYVDGLRKEIESTKQQRAESRLRATQAESKLHSVRGDNAKLQALLKRYRKMVAATQVAHTLEKPSSSPTDSLNSFSFTSGRFGRFNLDRSN